MKTEKADCLVIYCPEWFRDPAFVAYLNKYSNKYLWFNEKRWDRPVEPFRPIATWHIGGDPDEYSDTFIVFDHKEGSDIFQEEGLEYIWDAICELADAEGMNYGVVWLKNVEQENA